MGKREAEHLQSFLKHPTRAGTPWEGTWVKAAQACTRSLKQKSPGPVSPRGFSVPLLAGQGQGLAVYSGHPEQRTELTHASLLRGQDQVSLIWLDNPPTHPETPPHTQTDCSARRARSLRLDQLKQGWCPSPPCSRHCRTRQRCAEQLMMMLYYVPGISASSSSEFMSITHVNIQLSILSSTLSTRERSASRPDSRPILSITRYQPGHSFSLLPQARMPFPDHFQRGTRKFLVPDAHRQHQTTAPPLWSEALRGTHHSAPVPNWCGKTLFA